MCLLVTMMKMYPGFRRLRYVKMCSLMVLMAEMRRLYIDRK